MTSAEQIAKTESFVRKNLNEGSTGHGWWHTHRVRNLALHICSSEKADPLIVELTSLLHDIADHKFNDGDLFKGAEISREWLKSIHIDPTIVERVCSIIPKISFKGAKVADDELCIEGKIVQDADRLDAIGAIGIARTFAYGGFKNREIYDPGVNPKMHASFEEYQQTKSPTINHFYEKLLLIRDRLHTETAKKIANHRHTFMESFLEEFYAEWKGER